MLDIFYAFLMRTSKAAFQQFDYKKIWRARVIAIKFGRVWVIIHIGFQFQDIVNVVDRVFQQFSLPSFYKVRKK